MKIESSVYSVVTSEKSIPCGSAFAIGPKHFITCEHVFNKAKQSSSEPAIQTSSLGLVARLEWHHHPEWDFSIGIIKDGFPVLEYWLPVSLIDLSSIEEEFTCFGRTSPSSAASKWNASFSQADLNVGWIALTETIEDGTSGGPVMLGENVVAVINAKSGRRNQKYVIPFKAVWSWVVEKFPELTKSLRTTSSNKNNEEDRKEEFVIPVPESDGKAIISDKPQAAFRINANEIFDAMEEQYESKWAALRELGQNSIDANAKRISVHHARHGNHLVTSFCDDGHGMTLEVIKNFYLEIFSSSREDDPDTIGFFSTGKISIFRFNPVYMEVLTRSKGGKAYNVQINEDLSGKIVEVDENEFITQKKNLAPDHKSTWGTIVSFGLNFEHLEEMKDHIREAERNTRYYLEWVDIPIQFQCIKDTSDEEFALEMRTINVPVLNGLSHTKDYRTTIGGTAVYFWIGFEDGGKQNSDFLQLTVTSGDIFVEDFYEIPLKGEDNLKLDSLRIVIESTGFSTNIGRNRVIQDDFFDDCIDALVKKVVFSRVIHDLLDEELYSNTSYPFRLVQDLAVNSNKIDRNALNTLASKPFAQNAIDGRRVRISELNNEFAYLVLPHNISVNIKHQRRFRNSTLFESTSLHPQFEEYLSDKVGAKGTMVKNGVNYQNETNQKHIERSNSVDLELRNRNYSALEGQFYRSFETVIEVFEAATFLDSSSIKVSEFFTGEGEVDTITRSIFVHAENRTYLNYANKMVRSLVEAISINRSKDKSLEAHLLYRVVVEAEDTIVPASRRPILFDLDLYLRMKGAHVPQSLLRRVINIVSRFSYRNSEE